MTPDSYDMTAFAAWMDRMAEFEDPVVVERADLREATAWVWDAHDAEFFSKDRTLARLDELKALVERLEEVLNANPK